MCFTLSGMGESTGISTLWSAHIVLCNGMVIILQQVLNSQSQR